MPTYIEKTSLDNLKLPLHISRNNRNNIYNRCNRFTSDFLYCKCSWCDIIT